MRPFQQPSRRIDENKRLYRKSCSCRLSWSNLSSVLSCKIMLERFAQLSWLLLAFRLHLASSCCPDLGVRPAIARLSLRRERNDRRRHISSDNLSCPSYSGLFYIFQTRLPSLWATGLIIAALLHKSAQRSLILRWHLSLIVSCVIVVFFYLVCLSHFRTVLVWWSGPGE